MKIYQVSYITQSEGSSGYEYFSSREKAQVAYNAFKEKAGKDFDERSGFEGISFKPDKAGIVDLLNQYASHPDNG